MMDCSYFRSRINRYVDGELGYLETAELQRHLSFCADCSEELAQTSQVRGVLAAWGRTELVPAPGFADRVVAATMLKRPPAEATAGRVVRDALEALDSRLGRLPLPGGRTVPVKNLVGYGIAATAVIIHVERYLRRARELNPS